MELIRTQTRNLIRQFCVSHLVKIAIETPETLSDVELDATITVWNKKPRRIAVGVYIVNC